MAKSSSQISDIDQGPEKSSQWCSLRCVIPAPATASVPRTPLASSQGRRTCFWCPPALATAQDGTMTRVSTGGRVFHAPMHHSSTPCMLSHAGTQDQYNFANGMQYVLFIMCLCVLALNLFAALQWSRDCVSWEVVYVMVFVCKSHGTRLMVQPTISGLFLTHP